jgi:RNA polymerase sigma-70 factor, ECF subfamily
MPGRDDLYHDAVSAYGPALDRLARAYEAGVEDRRDLLQEIHLALWRSLDGFDGRCSLRTWVYRVAHNAAVSHILSSRRRKSQALVSIEEIAENGEIGAAGVQEDAIGGLERSQMIDRLYALVQRLNPVDRQIILLYLEGVDAASVGEVTGLSSGYVATKIHRIKKILAERFRNGGNDGA